MKAAFDVLMAAVDQDLKKIEGEPNTLIRIARSQERIKRALHEVTKIEGYDRLQEDQTMFVLFLRELLPQLHSKGLFYNLLFDLEIFKRTSSAEEYRRHCEERLVFIRQWQLENRKFIAYYYSGRQDLDYYEFIAKDGQNKASEIVSHLLGYEGLTSILKAAIQEHDDALEPATWTGTQTELVEQILGEHVTGHTRVNGQKVTLDYLVARAQKMYDNVSLKYFDEIASQIRRRQEGPTVYHEEKIKLIKERCDKLLMRRGK